jgi:surface antigen
MEVRMFPRACIKFAFAVAVAVPATLALTPQASAQWVLPLFDAALTNPFGRDAIDLSEEDITMLNGAMRSVLETREVGSQQSWQNDKSERAGVALLLKVYEYDGRPCGTVRHTFTKGGGKTYTLGMCKFEDGSWKIMP